MKLVKYFFWNCIILAMLNGCSGGNAAPRSTPNNVMPVTINGICGGSTNVPCVSITICDPNNPSNCQIINNISLDTGSVGLRIFKSAITNFNLPAIQSIDNGQLASCNIFGNYAFWGPVSMISLKLAGEPNIIIPFQIIDYTYHPDFANTICSSPYTNESSFGANGIMGINNSSIYECVGGESCANPQYYSCSTNNCNTTWPSKHDLLINPVAVLPVDNNGYNIVFPSIPESGAATVTGTITFGISTQENNIPNKSVQLYKTNQEPISDLFSFLGFFYTTLNGVQLYAIIDSGTPFFAFPSNLPTCDSDQLYCPTSTETLTAKVSGIDGIPTTKIDFQVANGLNIMNSSNNVFSNLAAPIPATLPNNVFIWGIPFFLGRTIYFGMESMTAIPFGTGPYVAF